jgi:hypothetical protein
MASHQRRILRIAFACVDFLMTAFSVPDDSTNLLCGLRQRNRAMSEVDVFTTSGKQLRDLAASFSRLR